MWEIYVLGDAGYIASILNALAMLANANIFLQLAAIGLLLGVIITVAQGLSQAGRINVGPVIGSLIVILIMFSQSTNVTIINVRTGGAQIVSNVPFGPVVIGSLVSRMGKSVSETIELAFSTPGMSEYGFFTPIKALAKMREMSADTALMDANTDPLNNGTDIDFSLINYFKDCTANALERKDKSITELRASKTPLDFIRWDSAFATTEIKIGGNISTLTCTLAYSTLLPIVDGAFKTRLQSTVVKMMRSSKDELENGGTIGANIIDYAAQKISQGSVNGGDLVLSSVLNRLFELGMLGRMEADRMWVKAATERDAINKRIESWQTEGSVFEHFMMPIMTFLEGLVFALAPFAALAIGLGAKGLQIAATYITLAIWVQLWMPLMSIVNHFTTEIAMASLSNIDSISNATGFPSWSSLNAIDSNLQTWLAVAGMLSSSVPFLAATVLFGGGQLIGKMGSMVSGSGSASGSAGISAPPVTNGAPAIKMNGGTRAEWSASSGAMRAGASAVAPNYNLGSSRQEMYKDAKQSSVSADRNLSTAVSRALANTETRNELAKQYSGMTYQEARNSGATGKYLAGEAEKIQKAAGLSASVGGKLMGFIAGGLEFAGSGMGGRFSLETGTNQVEEAKAAFEKADSKTTEYRKGLEKAIKADAGAGKETTASSVLSETGGEEFRDARSQAIKATKTKEDARQRAEVYNSNFQFDEATFANKKVQAAKMSEGGVEGLKSDMAALNQSFGIQGDVDRLAAQLMTPGNGFLGTQDGALKANVAAQARILNGISRSENLDGSERERGMREFDRQVGELFGLGFGGEGGLFENPQGAVGVDRELSEMQEQSKVIKANAGRGSDGAARVLAAAEDGELGFSDGTGAGERDERFVLDSQLKIKQQMGRVGETVSNGVEILDQSEVTGGEKKTYKQMDEINEKELYSNTEDSDLSVTKVKELANDLSGQAESFVDGVGEESPNKRSQAERRNSR